jgi:hypothetical protein
VCVCVHNVKHGYIYIYIYPGLRLCIFKISCDGVVTFLQLNMYPSLPFVDLDFHLINISIFRSKDCFGAPLDFVCIS